MPISVPGAALLGPRPGLPGTRPFQQGSLRSVIMPRGGVPRPPERVPGMDTPAGAASHPALTVPRESTPQRTRRREDKGGIEGGDKFGRSRCCEYSPNLIFRIRSTIWPG